MNYENIIKRKRKELTYAERRLVSAIDDFFQYVFHPDIATPITELQQRISKWEAHVTLLKLEIEKYQDLHNQKSFDYGFE